jgi:hypothetical protein
VEVAAVEKLIHDNSRRVNNNFHKQIRFSQNFLKQYEDSLAADMSVVTVDIETASQEAEINPGDRRFSQRPTVVAGEASRSTAVVLDGSNPNPAMRLAPRPTDELLNGDRLSNRYLTNPHSPSKFRGSNTGSIRASEMVEVPSESDIREIHEADETDDDENDVVDTNKGNIKIFLRFYYSHLFFSHL